MVRLEDTFVVRDRTVVNIRSRGASAVAPRLRGSAEAGHSYRHGILGGIPGRFSGCPHDHGNAVKGDRCGAVEVS